MDLWPHSGTSKKGFKNLVGKGENLVTNIIFFYHNVFKRLISVFDRVENIVGKGEIACTSNFSFSHNVLKSCQNEYL